MTKNSGSFIRRITLSLSVALAYTAMFNAEKSAHAQDGKFGGQQYDCYPSTSYSFNSYQLTDAQRQQILAQQLAWAILQRIAADYNEYGQQAASQYYYHQNSGVWPNGYWRQGNTTGQYYGGYPNGASAYRNSNTGVGAIIDPSLGAEGIFISGW